MEIFINDSKIEFQLENEKNLREIVDSINDWLFNDNKVIDEIIINDKLFSGRIEELEDYKIKEVKTVKLTAININVLVQSSLLETKRYLLDIYDILQEKKDINKEDIDKLYTGLEWVINVIQRSDNLYKYGEKIDKDMFDFLTHLSSLKEAKEFLGTLMRKNDINEARNFIKSNLINIIDLWTKKIDILIDNSTGEIGSMQSARTKVSTQIYKIINKIPDMLRMIKVITTDLRTGNEKQAMDSIQIIISTMESIISLSRIKYKKAFEVSESYLKSRNSKYRTACAISMKSFTDIRRIAILKKHRSLPEKEMPFTIINAGIRKRGFF